MRRVKADRVAGVAVAKARLDVMVIPGEKYFTENNDEAGTRRVANRLKRLGVQLTVLEATGGYERRLASELVLAGIPTAVVNPRNTRDFARAQGLLAKTDKLDAGVLAMYAERMNPNPHSLKARRSLSIRASYPADGSWCPIGRGRKPGWRRAFSSGRGGVSRRT